MTSSAGERRRVTAAVFLGPAAGFRIEELVLDPPGPGEVLVRKAASGVCHSDLTFPSSPPTRSPAGSPSTG